MIRQLHHACVLTSDIEALAQRLSLVLGLPEAPPARAVLNADLELRTTLLPVGNGTYLQLLEPHRGPGVDELHSGGEGALFEAAFEVEGASAAGQALRARGITPVDLLGRPLPDGFATAGSGSRFLYLPVDAVGGVRVELIEPVR